MIELSEFCFRIAFGSNRVVTKIIWDESQIVESTDELLGHARCPEALKLIHLEPSTEDIVGDAAR